MISLDRVNITHFYAIYCSLVLQAFPGIYAYKLVSYFPVRWLQRSRLFKRSAVKAHQPTPGPIPQQIQSLMISALLPLTEGLQLQNTQKSEWDFRVKNIERRLSFYMAAPWENSWFICIEMCKSLIRKWKSFQSPFWVLCESPWFCTNAKCWIMLYRYDSSTTAVYAK